MSHDPKRMSVTLRPASAKALDRMARQGGIPQADVMNRALLVLEFLVDEAHKGNDVYVGQDKENLEKVRILWSS